MSKPEIRFDDGAAYEDMMGAWSRLVGHVFLDWLRPLPGLRWADIGCGNGAFSDLIFERCAPSHLSGVDPSEAQLTYALKRLPDGLATMIRGGATELPFDDHSFDAVTMALVIFFIPDDAKAVAEMVRVAKPGASVSTYGWDILGGGLPVEPINKELPAIGSTPPMPPNPDAASLDNLRRLWDGAGLTDIETKVITVRRSFSGFDDYWTNCLSGPGAGLMKSLTQDQVVDLKSRVLAAFPKDANGDLIFEARANAIKGVVAA
jgi:SAM-dependent methyltransferase